jgi:SH3-like domain-containing protein
LKLRSLPTTASPESGCIEEGTAVALLQTVPDWSEALLDDGRRGWLASRFLSDAKPVAEALARDAFRGAYTPGATVSAAAKAELPAENTAASLPSPGATQLLRELEQTEALVKNELDQLVASQEAVLAAHEARTELSRRLLEATVAEFESRLTASDEQLRLSEAERAALVAKTGDLEADLNAAKSEVLRAEAERASLVERLAATQSELVQIEAIANAAKDALRREITTTESTLAALRGRLERRESQLAEAESKLASVEAERRALVAAAQSDEHAGPEAEIEDLRLALVEAEREKLGLEAGLEERRLELSQAEAKVAIMQSEIDRLESLAPGNRQEIEVTRGALGEASRRAAALEVRLEAADRENRALEAEIANLRRSSPRAPKQPEPGKAPAERKTAADDGLGAGVVVLESARPCLNFRAEPKLDSQAFDCLAPGTLLDSLGHWEGWRYVELTDGRVGWVSSRHLGPVGVGGTVP